LRDEPQFITVITLSELWHGSGHGESVPEADRGSRQTFDEASSVRRDNISLPEYDHPVVYDARAANRLSTAGS